MCTQQHPSASPPWQATYSEPQAPCRGQGSSAEGQHAERRGFGNWCTARPENWTVAVSGRNADGEGCCMRKVHRALTSRLRSQITGQLNKRVDIEVKGNVQS